MRSSRLPRFVLAGPCSNVATRLTGGTVGVLGRWEGWIFLWMWRWFVKLECRRGEYV